MLTTTHIFLASIIHFDTAQEAVRESEGRELNREELELIRTMAIAVGELYDAEKAAAELELIIAFRIKVGVYSLAQDAAKSVGRKLTQNEVDDIAFNGFHENGDAQQVLHLIEKVGISEKGISRLIGEAHRRGLPLTLAYLWRAKPVD